MFSFRLDVFYSVAKNLSFTKAAYELHITQPAVTSHIKALETTLGISLFKRDKNSIILTETGRLLLEYTEKRRREYDELIYHIGIKRNKLLGKLTIGASTTIEQYVLPPYLAEFNLRHHDVDIQVYNDNTMHVENDVQQHVIDLGIVEGNSGNREFKYIPFMEDEIVAVAHSSQTLSTQMQLNIEDLKSVPMIVREQGSGSLDVIMDKLKEKGIGYNDLNIIAHLGSTESIKTFLAQVNSISFVSVHAVSKEIVRGELQIIDIDHLEIKRTFNFIYPQGEQNNLVNEFIDFCLMMRAEI